MRPTIILLVLLYAQFLFAQGTPTALRPDIQVEHYLDVQPGATRMAYDALTGQLHYLTNNGNVYRVIDNGVTAPYDSLVSTSNDHEITTAQGLVFHDSDMFVVGNQMAGDLWHGIVARGHLLNSGLRAWTDVARTTYARGGKDHGFNAVVVTPDGLTLLVNSGARTDHGEVQSSGGIFPGKREEPVSAKILQLPIDGLDLIIPNDEVTLAASGFVYASGVRNTYDLAFNAEGDLFGPENSGDHDDPEELNWLQEGAHYGFPWTAGGNPNPTPIAGYDPVLDPRLNPGYPAADTDFTYDPGFPAPPNDVVFTEPIANVGPDADKIRDLTGGIIDASDNGITIGTFTCHRSPLGLIFDVDQVLGGSYTGDAFLTSFTQGGDSAGFNPNAIWGIPVVPVDPSEDLLHLTLSFDELENRYSLSAERIVSGLYLPVDAELVGHELYIIEYWTSTQRSMWKVTMPLANSIEEPDGGKAVGITLFPNPARDVLEWRTEGGVLTALDVFDALGQLVRSFSQSGITGHVPLYNLAPGPYIVRARIHGSWITRPLVVVH